MCNADIRAVAKQTGVYLYAIADKLGVSEPTMTRLMRRELPEEKKTQLKATPHKARASRFARILLAYFPSYCTSSPWRASARRRRACTI